MFESLSDKLNLVFKKLRGHGYLTEKNIEDALREVRLALLEADVHYQVVKDLIVDVKTRAVGQEVLESITPGQQVIKIVNESLTKIMGRENESLSLKGPLPVSIMLVGLQGSGKTTTAGKLAIFLRKKGRKPYLVPADVYRPAAISQLTQLAMQLDIPVYASMPEMNPIEICKNARIAAAKVGCDTVLIDTAGRLHVDEVLMAELQKIQIAIAPSDILLVADAMTGQDAVNMAKAFNESLEIGGVVLTKLDGDARGGAAISIRSVTGKPIKFIGVGEKLNDLDVFYPNRMANRILGMGDVLGLIEKAQATIDQKEAQFLEKKLRKNEFSLEDFRNQMNQIRKMGSLTDLLGMIPGLNLMKPLKNLQVDDRELVQIEAIINSMTMKERRNHTVINGSRRQRIAKGSGTDVRDVNRLLKSYTEMLNVVKSMNKGGPGKKTRRGLPF